MAPDVMRSTRCDSDVWLADVKYAAAEDDEVSWVELDVCREDIRITSCIG